MSLAPALAAGNTIVLKPSRSRRRRRARARAAGRARPASRRASSTSSPASARRGEALVDHPGVAKVVVHRQRRRRTRRSRRRAAQRLASCMLELGGKSAEHRVRRCRTWTRRRRACWPASSPRPGRPASPARARYIQRDRSTTSCVDRLGRARGAITLGDPLDAATQMGPVATKTQLEKDESMVAARGRARAPTCCRGGARAASPGFPDGFFYEPTIVTGVDNDSRDAQTRSSARSSRCTPFEDEAEARRARQRHRVRPRRRRLDARRSSARTGWRAGSRPARCGSTPTAR